jgi:hypothetical protein
LADVVTALASPSQAGEAAAAAATIVGSETPKTLFDVYTVIASLTGSGSKTLTDIHTAVAALATAAAITGNPGKTLADLYTDIHALLAAKASITPVSSGTTAIVTETDAAVTAVAASATNTYHHVRIINESSAAGFYSLDGGTTWNRLPAGPVSIKDDDLKIVNKAIQIKRVPGGTDLSGVYVSAW